ncbi:tRNA (N(6)-L-threonylcarbamoyladenosine(37)-C(2))-methylthiotransferase MtaB [Desulfosediminicola ganghwensis]|uniref:tRNA (N(6)-L-threonylcarbamoyladenosine(37)-C(2))- methylthiotransferase MtaB n=1 Tax=Desulfosediminicola ganghwensis TaxID=2569540 RepID=UPI0010ACE56F|nr:tRNA (N(6)-L-threonylcarbamoyladenosine(37)-C(2))-methylthiotransferase MtaB [Desulfosediminicola ganghwensis]
MKRVLLTTLGCKVNQYESAAFRTSFTEAGHMVVRQGEEADIVVINTCAVTANAGAQSRNAVRQAVRNNPDARLMITGCYAEIAAEQLSQLEELAGRDFSIIGNSKKDILVPTAVEYDVEMQQMLLGAINEASEICRLPVRQFGDRTRAYLRIQDGCESFCTYCIVPYTRGPSRSLPIGEVISQAKTFAEEGYQELVLTGIHLGYYGRDLDEGMDITRLIDRLSLETPHVRYRISSLEPTEITDHLLDLMETRNNIMPHFHIPLQSGDDEILSRMNRKYTTAEFRAVVEKCLAKLPEAAIGIDILAGFPGETEQHFTNTRDFLASIGCTYLHVFPYSRRPGTVAASYNDDVPKSVKDRRVAELRKLGTQKKDIFHKRQVGRIVPVLVEGKRDSDGFLKGFSDNYVPVRFKGEDTLKKCIVQVQLTEIDGAQVKGEICRNHESGNNCHR